MKDDIDIDDITADITAAFEAGETPAATPEATPEPAAEAAPAAPEQPEEGDDGRLRGPDGKFIAKSPETAQIVAEPEVTPEPARTIRPPASWSATAKADFAALPEHIQQEVLKREKEIEDGKAQWDTKAEKFNRFDSMLAPHRDRLTLAGLDDYGYLNALIRADEMLRTNPQEALPQILRMYGLEAPQAQQQPFYGQQQPDPVVQTLSQQLAQLQSRLDAQETERQQATRSEIDGEIAAFAADPANLYYENVKPEMASLLKEGLATDLKDAYDKACHMRPDIRALLARPPAAAKPNGQKAGVSVTGAPGLGQPPKAASDPNRSIEDDIRSAMEEVEGVV